MNEQSSTFLTEKKLSNLQERTEITVKTVESGGAIDIILQKNTNSKEHYGNASLQKIRQPLPHIFLNSLDIIPRYRFKDKKYGSILLEEVNALLRNKKMVGVVNNAIESREFPKKYDNQGKILDPRDLYWNHDWVPMSGDLPYFIYNPPGSGIETEEFIRQYIG